jgi:hypothetical protein
MRLITADEWRTRVSLPGFCATPIKLAYQDWKDPSDPLGSLVEVIKWATLAPQYLVPPSVFAGQVFLESDMGAKQDALLGVKATKKDYENGTWKRMRTTEHFSKNEIERLEKIDETLPNDKKTIIDILGETSQGSGFFIVKCWQDFHFEEGLVDDFEKYFKFYTNRKPDREKWFKSGPEEYLKNVTVAPPYSYATDVKYVGLVMSKIKRYSLHQLDV